MGQNHIKEKITMLQKMKLSWLYL